MAVFGFITYMYFLLNNLLIIATYFINCLVMWISGEKMVTVMIKPNNFSEKCIYMGYNMWSWITL